MNKLIQEKMPKTETPEKPKVIQTEKNELSERKMSQEEVSEKPEDGKSGKVKSRMMAAEKTPKNKLRDPPWRTQHLNFGKSMLKSSQLKIEEKMPKREMPEKFENKFVKKVQKKMPKKKKTSKFKLREKRPRAAKWSKRELKDNTPRDDLEKELKNLSNSKSLRTTDVLGVGSPRINSTTKKETRTDKTHNKIITKDKKTKERMNLNWNILFEEEEILNSNPEVTEKIQKTELKEPSKLKPPDLKFTRRKV